MPNQRVVNAEIILEDDKADETGAEVDDDDDIYHEPLRAPTRGDGCDGDNADYEPDLEVGTEDGANEPQNLQRGAS